VRLENEVKEKKEGDGKTRKEVEGERRLKEGSQWTEESGETLYTRRVRPKRQKKGPQTKGKGHTVDNGVGNEQLWPSGEAERKMVGAKFWKEETVRRRFLGGGKENRLHRRG